MEWCCNNGSGDEENRQWRWSGVMIGLVMVVECCCND